MTHEFDTGLHLLIEPSGIALTEDEKRTIESLQPVGVMFRKRNFVEGPYETWFPVYEKLHNDISELIHRDHIIFSIDHEGGRVIRPPLPITRFPYPARWSDKVQEVSIAIAIELTSLGINLSFSPTVDIHSNPNNPVINERSFGRTAEEVISRSIVHADTLRNAHICPCVKHFPGHGDTSSDSHTSLPILQFSKEQLRKRELVPFVAHIRNGIDMIMSSHILFPEIDSKYPATLSRAIMKGLLRDDLGFDGVIIADALGMAGISSFLSSSAEGSKLALQANLDIFLMVGDTVTMADSRRLKAEIESHLKDGHINEHEFRESQNRIQSLLSTLTDHLPYTLSKEIFASHHALAQSLVDSQPWTGFELVAPGFE